LYRTTQEKVAVQGKRKGTETLSEVAFFSSLKEYMKKEDQLSAQMIALERWFQIERDMEDMLGAHAPSSGATVPGSSPNLAHLRSFQGWSYAVSKDKVSPFLFYLPFFIRGKHIICDLPLFCTLSENLTFLLDYLRKSSARPSPRDRRQFDRRLLYPKYQQSSGRILRIFATHGIFPAEGFQATGTRTSKFVAKIILIQNRPKAISPFFLYSGNSFLTFTLGRNRFFQRRL
jgi:hypothetical protein